MSTTTASSAAGAADPPRAALNRIDHTTLRVRDLDESVRWYGDALDFQLVDRTERQAVLTVGGDGQPDLVLQLGGAGIAAFALGVPELSVVEDLHEDLNRRGVRADLRPSSIPGIDTVLDVPSPEGQTLQVVGSADRPTGICNPARSGGVAPIDTDHATLLVRDVRGYAAWLKDTLGFATSDAVAAPGNPDAWIAAWTHVTPQHHDVAMIATENDARTLHHVAFLAADLNHMGEIADRVCSLTEDGRCEWGIGKHGGLGANNYLYFFDPSGNRIEINSNMDANPFDRDISIYPGEQFSSFISIWNHVPPPETFNDGS